MATATAAAPASYNWPPIPASQITQLQDLAASNQLSGVPPQVIAVIDLAESSGKGGSINSEGYGGYFGLGANKSYPGGTTSTEMLTGTSPQDFSSQAVIAASAFASYLSSAGGNPVKAEQIYQTGSAGGSPGEGAKLMAQYTGGATVSTAAVSAATTAENATTPSCTTVIGEGGVLGIGSATLLNSCQAQEIMGAVLIGIGGLMLLAGVGILLIEVGKRSPAIGAIVGGVAGGPVGAAVGGSIGERNQQRASERRIAEQTQISEARASARRSTQAPSSRSVGRANARRGSTWESSENYNSRNPL